MSEKIDLPLDQFLSEVTKRNTKPDGSLKDPRLIERMNIPTCQGCHEKYRQKYPGMPFKVVCNGIYDEEDYAIIYDKLVDKVGEEFAPSVEEIREIHDPAFWASRHIVVKDDNGNLVSFIARWYQEEILRCTAKQKVDRCSRGTGKTSIGVIEELHKAVNNKNYEILVVCPADAQSEKWFSEIQLQIDNSPTLGDAVVQRKQSPFKMFRFNNGSTISIFTAGSASGRGANSIRSQSPRKVRCEEQDYLAEKDWEAIDPLLNRYSNSEFHGASTPTGLRNKFWHMCIKFPRFKEFHFPVNVLPDWNKEREEQCIIEARTADRYRHEYLAEFGDPAQGVFKAIFIDAAKKPYLDPNRPHLKGYSTCQYNPGLKYFMGVDWNGEGTGTRIRVVSYDPITRIRQCVAAHTVDESTWTVNKSIDAIQLLNKQWHCEKIYIDRGYGQAQDEMIRLRGMSAPSNDPDTKRLKDIVAIDFGAKLVTNKLVPIRDTVSKYKTDDTELERPTKPFMVEGAVMALETGLIEFYQDDTILEEQLRAYRVKNYSSHGYPSSYEADGDSGDHDLDAFMLALLAVEMTYGMFRTPDELKKWSQVVYVGNFSSSIVNPDPVASRREQVGIPNRSNTTNDSNQGQYRLAYLSSHCGIVTPIRSSASRSGTGYRTAIFRKDQTRKLGR